jgi:hypothetical protein
MERAANWSDDGGWLCDAFSPAIRSKELRTFSVFISARSNAGCGPTATAACGH